MFGPTSATGPWPNRNSCLATCGSVVHAASDWHIAHGSADDAAAITPSRSTRSPRTSAAATASDAITAVQNTYGAASQLHPKEATR